MSHLVSLSSWVESCLCQRHFLRVPRISMWVSSVPSAEQGTSPKLLFNWYTSWYKAMASSWVVSLVSSSRVGTSTQRSFPRDGCQQPQQIPQLHSLCPAASTWANILSYRYGWCSLPESHCGSSSKNRYLSNICSALQTEMLFSSPNLFAVVVFPTL